MSENLTDQDWRIRLYIYQSFVARGQPPSHDEVAQQFRVDPAEARAAYQRLHEHHTLFLEPGADVVRMANPLSAVPTAYRVYVGEMAYWANCAWDSLGIPAMLGADARIEATLAHAGETVTYAVERGSLKADPFLVHFPLPFVRWYDDLLHT
jgi:hypothetical protein